MRTEIMEVMMTTKTTTVKTTTTMTATTETTTTKTRSKKSCFFLFKEDENAKVKQAGKMMSIRITLHVHWKGDDDEDGGNHDNDENYPPCPLQAPFTCWLTGAPLTMGGVWGYWLWRFGHHHVNHHHQPHHHNNHHQSRGIGRQARHHDHHHEDEH